MLLIFVSSNSCNVKTDLSGKEQIRKFRMCSKLLCINNFECDMYFTFVWKLVFSHRYFQLNLVESKSQLRLL